MNLGTLLLIGSTLLSQAHASTQVAGQWYVIDRSGRSAPAQALVVTLETSQGQMIAESVTDDAGNFLITLAQTPTELRARIHSRSLKHRVIGNSAQWGGEYTFVSGPQRIIQDRLNTIRDSRYNALIAAHETNGKLQASTPFLIAQDLHVLSQFLGKNGTRGDLIVSWTSKGASSAGYVQKNRTTYLPSGTPSRQDTVTAVVPALLDNGGNLTTSNTCLPRPSDDAQWDPICAYRAGVADFLWMAMNQSPVILRPSGRSVHFESDPNAYPAGAQVSGRVAATLWDLLDPANEPGDRMMEPFSAIWDVINQSSLGIGPVADFESFMIAYNKTRPAQSQDWALLLEWNGQTVTFQRQAIPEEYPEDEQEF